MYTQTTDSDSIALGWNLGLYISEKLPGDAHVAGLWVTLWAAKSSTFSTTAALLLLPLSFLWVPHNALFRLRNRATSRSTLNYFFSLYLICRLWDNPSEAGHSKDLISPGYGTQNANSVPQPQKVLILQEQQQRKRSDLKSKAWSIQNELIH